MKFLFAIFGFVAVVFQAAAQTNNAEMVFKTNYVSAVDWYRDVEGKLYNTKASVLWETFDANCVKIEKDAAIVTVYTNQPVYETVIRDRRPYENPVPGSDIRFTTSKVLVDEKRVPSRKIAIRNLPAPAIGEAISFRAMRVGTIDDNGSTLELWDYGTQHKVAVVLTNYINTIDAKAVTVKK